MSAALKPAPLLQSLVTQSSRAGCTHRLRHTRNHVPTHTHTYAHFPVFKSAFLKPVFIIMSGFSFESFELSLSSCVACGWTNTSKLVNLWAELMEKKIARYNNYPCMLGVHCLPRKNELKIWSKTFRALSIYRTFSLLNLPSKPFNYKAD